MPREMLKQMHKEVLAFTDNCVDNALKNSDCEICEALSHHIHTYKTSIEILLEQQEEYLDVINHLHNKLQTYEGA